MHPYLPHTKKDIDEMLAVIGISSLNELFSDIPEGVHLKENLRLPDGLSEYETYKVLKGLADKNLSTEEVVCFLGAGAYDHYVPTTIDTILSRSEFYTAYTPYQPEISQGTLQAIFEYQSMICALTGMDVSNASLYDGATAVAEGAFMACASTRRDKVIVSATVHPMVKKVLKTYLDYKDLQYIEVESQNGVSDKEEILKLVDKTVATVIIQTPNFFGHVEDLGELADALHKVKALLTVSVDPIGLGIYKSPSEMGADIVVGEAQGLGNSLNFGGPYLGFIACTKKLMRKLPGRIVGETEDVDGKRAYVLTLQAREQHIRREKATSNITSNEALCALGATVYMATMGKSGLREVAERCVKATHYMARALESIESVTLPFDAPYFKEFVIKIDSSLSIKEINKALLLKGYLSGFDLGTVDEKYKDHMLLCATEKRTKAEIDGFVNALKEVLSC